jgi:hypothetical protein
MDSAKQISDALIKIFREGVDPANVFSDKEDDFSSQAFEGTMVTFSDYKDIIAQ